MHHGIKVMKPMSTDALICVCYIDASLVSICVSSLFHSTSVNLLGFAVIHQSPGPTSCLAGGGVGWDGGGGGGVTRPKVGYQLQK